MRFVQYVDLYSLTIWHIDYFFFGYIRCFYDQLTGSRNFLSFRMSVIAMPCAQCCLFYFIFFFESV